MEPGLLANNALLEALTELPVGTEVNDAIPRRWQRDLFAEEVAAILAGG